MLTVKQPRAPPALRPAARALRQEVLQLQHQLASSPASSASDLSEHSEDADLLSSSPTRIHEEPEEEDDDDRDHDNRRRTMSVPSPSPFALKQFAPAPGSPFASLSNATAPGPAPYSDASPTGGRFRNGRVRGMVRSFESSGSEADEGSPERERGNGSGFRNGGAGGSGFRAAANGSGFRNGNESESESGEDGVGGTVRAQRALPVRPDGAEGVLDLGATVRGGSEHGHGHGRTSSNRTRAPGGDYTSNSNSNTNTAREDEMTVEELLALEGDAAPAQGVLSPAHTGGGAGSWRRNRRRGHKAAGGQGQGTEEIQTQRTGESVTPQRTGGGRPLPAHPHASPLARSSSGGVHAWESDEEPVGGTVKWVPANVPAAATLFASITELPPTPPRDQEATPPRNHEAEAAAAAARERARVAMVAEAEAQERGRARGAAVRAQLQEAAALRTLVDAFRVRLEEVERRVGVMEAEASSSAAALGAPNSETSLSVVQRLDPRRLLALFAPVPRKRGGEEGAKNNGNNANNFVGPTTLGALPSYVLLVSLGMCAVVLRVLVKKSLGAVRRGA
ncbi:hypothetical protein C8R46DRAFT_1308756 [Mycena filopes]|nr:hypothetical protein C8R46DRAFT_1308756 [Mycena filopes]